jgi:c-di-GMP-binding flagellar brake protein YcgR
MENRRQTYRHAFDPEEALRVALLKPGTDHPIDCELLNLSLGGMRVRLRDDARSLRAGDSVVSRLLGRDSPEPVELSLALPSQIVHLERRLGSVDCGVHFLPTANPGTNENIERILARFLIAEQRRLRRQARAE